MGKISKIYNENKEKYLKNTKNDRSLEVKLSGILKNQQNQRYLDSV